MRQLASVCAMALTLLLVACGGSTNNFSNINGNWTASLANSNGTAAFGFTTTLSQNSNGTVSVSNVNFKTSSPCFTNGETASGALALSGTTNGVVSGGFQLIITSTPSAPMGPANALTLNGTVMNANTISGTWSLTGLQSGCTGSGNFTMTKM
jgi:hypothetical protein